MTNTTLEIALERTVSDVLGRNVSKASRAELRSHLEDAALARAARESRVPTAADVDAAVDEAGGRDALARAFGAERFPPKPAARAALGGLVGFRALGALLGLVACVYAVSRAGFAPLPMIAAGVGVIAVVLAIACIVHLYRRHDLDGRERTAWLVALLVLEPIAAIAYLALGRAGSKDLAARIFPESA
jgi:hypothetical protein